MRENEGERGEVGIYRGREGDGSLQAPSPAPERLPVVPSSGCSAFRIVHSSQERERERVRGGSYSILRKLLGFHSFRRFANLCVYDSLAKILTLAITFRSLDSKELMNEFDTFFFFG